MSYTGKRKQSHPPAVPSVQEFLPNLLFALGDDAPNVPIICTAAATAGYPVSQSLLYEQLRKLRAGEPLYSDHKNTGRDKLLSEEALFIMEGFLEQQIIDGESTTLDLFKQKIEELFHIEVSMSTSRNYLEDMGFFFRKMQTKSAGFKLTVDQQKEMVLDFLKTQRSRGGVMYELSKKRRGTSLVASLDFTFTGHRLLVETTWARSGRPPCRKSQASLASPTVSSPAFGAMA